MTVSDRKGWIVPEVTVDVMTGVRITHADMPLLDRVLTALRSGDEDGDERTAFPVPGGYLGGGGGDRMRRRPEWRFEQPPEFRAALARLRRVTVVCPGAEVRHHSEVPWRWTGTVPGVCDGDKPVFVTGADLGELAGAMEAAVERRARTRSALDGLRVTWGDGYGIWYADKQWWALRRDGLSDPVCAPTPDALCKLMTEDAAFCPVRL
jgi:hypothetical protein